jgi:hypothetical protein
MKGSWCETGPLDRGWRDGYIVVEEVDWYYLFGTLLYVQGPRVRPDSLPYANFLFLIYLLLCLAVNEI